MIKNMPIKKKQKKFIEAAHAAGARPVRNNMGNMTLSHEGKRVMLSTGRQQSVAGKFFYQIAGEAFPEFGQSFAKGNGEFVVIAGRERKLRAWDARRWRG